MLLARVALPAVGAPLAISSIALGDSRFFRRGTVAGERPDAVAMCAPR
jgi:hypothetical protein